MSVTGIVAALTAEARTLGPAQPARSQPAVGITINTLADGTLLVISGMGEAAAAQAALALVAAGAGALLSFGLAGGLDPALAAGAVLLPRAVLDETGTLLAACESWREQLAAHRSAAAGTLLSLARPLTTQDEKAQARARSGAVAVDMESAAIGRVARERGVKFAVARVVVDTATDSLPRSVLAATDPRGAIHAARLVAGLLRRPSEIVALLRLARRYRQAIVALRVLADAGLARS